MLSNSRKCKLIPPTILGGSVTHSNVEVYFDEDAEKEIVEFLVADSARLKKFRRILAVILTGKYNKDLYGKEDVSGVAENVTAMKFKTKPNSRIYCKEFFKDGKKVVLIELLENKDTQKASDKKIKSRLEAIGRRNYEF
jgi:hypothetical protein